MKNGSTRTRWAGPSEREAYEASLPMVNSPPGIQTMPGGGEGGRLKSRVAAYAAANAARASPAMIKMRLIGVAEVKSSLGHHHLATSAVGSSHRLYCSKSILYFSNISRRTADRSDSRTPQIFARSGSRAATSSACFLLRSSTFELSATDPPVHQPPRVPATVVDLYESNASNWAFAPRSDPAMARSLFATLAPYW